MDTTKDKVLMLDEEDEHEKSGGQSSATMSVSASVSSESIYESFEVSLAEDLHRRAHNKQILYHIVNELCTTEAKFVDTLRLLNVKFRKYIQNESRRHEWPNQINNCINNLLKHLPQLQELNDYLLGELESARDQWARTQKISHILVKIGPFLKHYSSYIKEFEHNQSELNYCMRKWAQFADKIHEFELNEPMANKLCIQHHLLRPIQRIPQYRLLLEHYLHYLCENDADYSDTVAALRVVSQVAEHANQSMNVELNFSKSLASSQQGLLSGIWFIPSAYNEAARSACSLIHQQQQQSCVFVRECELMKVSRKHLVARVRRWMDSFRKSLGSAPVGDSDDIAETTGSGRTMRGLVAGAQTRPKKRKKTATTTTTQVGTTGTSGGAAERMDK